MGPTFASPGSRSTAAILALYVKIGACLLAIGADVGRIATADGLRDGRLLVDDLLGADRLVTLATLLEVVTLVLAAVLFLRWQVVLHRNLPALGDPEPRFGVVAGVVSWFVPGLNFVRPLLVVAELERAGERDRTVPRLLLVWWAAWLTAVVAVLLAWTLLGDAETVGDRQRIDALRAGATALSAVAAALTIAVVATVTGRQERRATQVGAPRASVAPPRRSPEDAEGGLRVVSEHEALPPRLDA